MKVHFISKSKDNKTEYDADLTKVNDNLYTFPDKSSENTTISLYIISNEEIDIYRDGDVNMDLKFVEGYKTRGKYKSKLGLEFNYEIFTKKLSVKSNEIKTEYDLYLDNKYNETYKITLLIY